MKAISIFLIGCLTAFAVCAQNITNTVTIKLNSNRYQEVLVDGKTYPVTNTSTSGTTTNAVVTITDLQPGQHELQFVRINQTNNTRRNVSRAFNLRARYDLVITVNNDGSFALNETRNRNRGTAGRYATPMSDANFSALLQNIEGQRRATAKTTAVTNAFAGTANYFTTDQAAQLLEFVTSESKRLSLAKSVYPKITDPSNIAQLNDLFDNETNRDAFTTYVNSYNASHPVYNNNNGYGYNNQAKIAMTNANFNVLLQDVKKEWLPGAKMSALTSAFSNTNNYFNTYQAKQLIQLVSDENNRLQLAKSAYSRITDPSNFSQLNDLFSSQAKRNELAAYVNSYNSNTGINTNTGVNGNQYRTAMSDAGFNALVEDVKKEWLPGAKMSALTSIFANTNNYFSAYQAKQLIQLVSDEDNRLQLAKSASRNIVDLSNFSQLYDLFTSQARRDELKNYINSYSYNQ